MLQPVAKATRLYGSERSGGLVLALRADFPEEFAPDRTPLFARIGGLPVPLWCESFERRSTTSARVEFADLDTAQRAAELIGHELFIETEAPEPDGEFRMEDLIGFRIVVPEGEGRVTDCYDSQVNPLLEIALGGRTYLVPAVGEFFTRIDFEGCSIELSLPEGLLEVQRMADGER